MKLEEVCDNRINYQESCFIVNAMNYYMAKMCENNTNLSKETKEYYSKIIEKYIKLEKQIINLQIK